MCIYVCVSVLGSGWCRAAANALRVPNPRVSVSVEAPPPGVSMEASLADGCAAASCVPSSRPAPQGPPEVTQHRPTYTW